MSEYGVGRGRPTRATPARAIRPIGGRHDGRGRRGRAARHGRRPEEPCAPPSPPRAAGANRSTSRSRSTPTPPPGVDQRPDRDPGARRAGHRLRAARRTDGADQAGAGLFRARRHGAGRAAGGGERRAGDAAVPVQRGDAAAAAGVPGRRVRGRGLDRRDDAGAGRGRRRLGEEGFAKPSELASRAAAVAAAAETTESATPYDPAEDFLWSTEPRRGLRGGARARAPAPAGISPRSRSRPAR